MKIPAGTRAQLLSSLRSQHPRRRRNGRSRRSQGRSRVHPQSDTTPNSARTLGSYDYSRKRELTSTTVGTVLTAASEQLYINDQGRIGKHGIDQYRMEQRRHGTAQQRPAPRPSTARPQRPRQSRRSSSSAKKSRKRKPEHPGSNPARRTRSRSQTCGRTTARHRAPRPEQEHPRSARSEERATRRQIHSRPRRSKVSEKAVEQVRDSAEKYATKNCRGHKTKPSAPHKPKFGDAFMVPSLQLPWRNVVAIQHETTIR